MQRPITIHQCCNSAPLSLTFDAILRHKSLIRYQGHVYAFDHVFDYINVFIFRLRIRSLRF